MANQTVPRRSVAQEIAQILDSPEINGWIVDLERTRWTGRRGYPTRSLVGASLAKALYAIPTWTATVRLIDEHQRLSEAIGGAPSVYACYRFASKLRCYKPLLQTCLDHVADALRVRMPEYGKDIAIDASDLPAYANGQRYVSKGGAERERFSDPDASWGHRSAISVRKGGGFYGYRLHLATCARTDLPLVWQVETAKTNESRIGPALLDSARGFQIKTCAMDKGYDLTFVYEACEARNVTPVIPVRETRAVKQGAADRPVCEHGAWAFAGGDFKRRRTKWRCPTAACRPASRWVKSSRLQPLIPRHTKRWRDLYRGRAAVERAVGRLKNEYGLKPLRVRGQDRVALHADLCALALLARALAQARSALVVA